MDNREAGFMLESVEKSKFKESIQTPGRKHISC